MDGGDEGRQQGALLSLGLRKGDDEEGWAERVGDPKGQVEVLGDVLGDVMLGLALGDVLGLSYRTVTYR